MPLPDTCQSLTLANGQSRRYYSLPALEAAGIGRLSRLPVCLRIVLESVLRNLDGRKITEAHVQALAHWAPQGERTEEIPFMVARVLLQDFTGVPLLADLAAMRDVARETGKDPGRIEPLVPVDLVVDHSVQLDYFGTPDALQKNMELEFRRNHERYQFLKWGMQAFDTFRVVPPGIGIVHQVNLEYLFRGVQDRNGLLFPDSLVGTDSHTTMINGAGVVAWGVGGIEGEAAMLGQPVYFLTPDVVGVELRGRLHEGVTVTDLVLTLTEMLRAQKVVGKFIEFFGAGVSALSVAGRGTLGNMAPEYGATMAFFPVDENTVAYLRGTGHSDDEIDAFERYFRAQQLFGVPKAGDIDYSEVLVLDLDGIVPSLAGPRRPQDRVALPDMRRDFEKLFSQPAADFGFNKDAAELGRRFPTTLSLPCRSRPLTPMLPQKRPLERQEVEMLDNHPGLQPPPMAPQALDIGHGDVLLAAITSCTNTSNPNVMLAAGLLAKNAVEKGLFVSPRIKTAFGPGSRVVPDYLRATGLQPYLDQLGFDVAGFGCTACIGNSGDLPAEFNEAIVDNDIIACAVLSGNRNFEARIHPNLRANYLASPPLVVAFALAGRMNIDLTREPLGRDLQGAPVYLRDIWPRDEEIDALLAHAMNPDVFRERYGDLTQANDLWAGIATSRGDVYGWPDSTYIARPPFLDDFTLQPGPVSAIKGARALLCLGDSVTTDHISPAGAFRATTPAGEYLVARGVAPVDFNTYGSRRGHHDVMMRGTFANVRLKNLMLPLRPDGSRIEGGYTLLDGEVTSVYDAAMAWRSRNIPTVIFAGEEYGTGSSRDWAAKGTQLLGVKAVIAKSFERIHRSNLVGMGVLPLQFKEGASLASLGLTGAETFDLHGITADLQPRQDITLRIHAPGQPARDVLLTLRIDTPIEADYYRHGGILPYVLRELLTG
ncbi:MAG: aconitate hydratase [Moraxellaceae bacterium]|jgi:aconitate hydratase|nr:aconitate hydratase [Moraxellaceae bacterium]